MRITFDMMLALAFAYFFSVHKDDGKIISESVQTCEENVVFQWCCKTNQDTRLIIGNIICSCFIELVNSCTYLLFKMK
jgi:hypothetical protein